MDVHQHALVERQHVADPRFVDLVTAHQCLVSTLENLHDSPFRAVAVPESLDAGDHTIAVHRLHEARRRHVDVRGALTAGRAFGDDEAEAAATGLQAADDEVHLVGQAVAPAAQRHQGAARHEKIELAAERHALVARHVEYLHQLAHRRGVMHVLANELKNLV